MRPADSSSLSRFYKSELLHLDSNKAAADLHQELVSMRRLAFFCVSISVAVTFLGAFLVPFLYNQIQYVHSMAQDEMEFCRSRTTNIWREIGRTERVAGSKQKRQTNERLKCCGCGVGTEGIPGLPGTDGQDGQDGQQGIPGLDSIPFDFPVPSQLQPQQWCFVCEEAVPGPIGPPGKRGPKGRDGIDGAPGADGIAGEQGMIGVHGPQGVPGLLKSTKKSCLNCNLMSQDCLESRENPALPGCCWICQALKVRLDHQDRPDCPVLLASPASLDVQERMDSPERWEIRERRERREPMASRACAGLADIRVDPDVAITARCREPLPGIEPGEKSNGTTDGKEARDGRRANKQTEDGRLQQ